MSEYTKLTKEFEDGWAHFCKCIDFNHSALDADAIRFMNEMPSRICSSHDALLTACESVQGYKKAAEEGRVGDEDAGDYWGMVMDEIDTAIAKAKSDKKLIE